MDCRTSHNKTKRLFLLFLLMYPLAVTITGCVSTSTQRQDARVGGRVEHRQENRRDW